MMRILFRMTFAVALVLVLTATGLWAAGAEEEPAAAADKKYVTDPTTGEVVVAPEYGGTLTYAKNSWPPNTDTLAGGRWASQWVWGVLDKPAVADWGMDRNEYPLNLPWPTLDVLRGSLVERWEQTDDLTIVFHLRDGVRWHDKEPMNGREFAADDIVFNYHRMLGIGSGFTEPSPQLTAQLAPIKVESATAVDNTVVFTLKEPNIGALQGLVDEEAAYMYPPEVIKQHGDATDWKTLVGTGPFQLTDLVEESSATWTRNPDYWGYDEKYPDNRLPYVDEVRALHMPEAATYLSAIRTRKVDTGYRLSSIDQVDGLQRSNPEIQMYTLFNRSNDSWGMNVQEEPFGDIRVRKAMQMALDLETANTTFFKGLAEMTPYGPNRLPGFYVPFEEWPEEVKKVFAYDPEGAEALLDEAGYPRGSDGIRFKTVLSHHYNRNLGYAELAAGFWRDIGVDVEIKIMATGPEIVAARTDRDYKMTSTEAAMLSAYPARFWSGNIHNTANPQDPWYDSAYEALGTAESHAEYQAMVREMDMYGIEQFWHVWGGMAPQIVPVQPWVIGYNGELNLGSGQYWLQYSRMWIDSALKQEMGY
ncbi:MAG: ABC transporter substrate-binding protein [Spirochaetaceae bacterium]|nr:ABC transporter substrate-binding protein [Spirochaetaceae bacterium]